MSTFDSGVLIITGLSLGFSFFKGMIREIFSLLAYFTGYFCANRFSNEASSYLSEFIANQSMAKIFGFFLVFIGVSILVKLVGMMFKSLMAASGMSFFDRFIGGLLGVVKAIFLISLGMMILALFPDLDKKVTEGSQTAPYLRQTAAILKQNMFSVKILEKGSKTIDTLKRKVDSLKQFKELSQPSNELNRPQDTHWQLGKQELESILRTTQKIK